VVGGVGGVVGVDEAGRERRAPLLLTALEVENAEGVPAAFVDHGGDPPAVGGGHGRQDVVVLVDEPPDRPLRVVRVDLQQPHEFALQVAESEEAGACPDGVRDQLGAAEQGPELSVRCEQEGLVGERVPEVRHRRRFPGLVPGEPAPVAATVNAVLHLARRQVDDPQDPVRLAARVVCEAGPPTVRVEGDVPVDGLAVAGDALKEAAAVDHAELPGLVAAAIVPYEEAEGCPAQGQGAVLAGRLPHGESTGPVQPIRLAQPGHVGREVEGAVRGRSGKVGAGNGEELLRLESGGTAVRFHCGLATYPRLGRTCGKAGEEAEGRGCRRTAWLE
jgi:hypothetical protein